MSIIHNVSSAVVVIGFEQQMYSVNESDGQVVLAVVVMNGELLIPVTVSVTTVPDTAEGKCS